MGNLTPMMQQYQSLKKQYSDSILFFRLGDFYEMFGEDAREAARILDIALTSRNKGGGNKTPMAGVPAHSASSYIAKLIESDYRVAICEQIEDAEESSGLVDRDVIRVITPGTVIEDEILPERENNYLAALSRLENRYGFAYIDISTGEFAATEVNKIDTIIDEIDRLQPSELILSEKVRQSSTWENYRENNDFQITPGAEIELQQAGQILEDFFENEDGEGYSSRIQNLSAAQTSAAEIINYIKQTQKKTFSHIKKLESYFVEDYMVLDASTRRNLELCQTIREQRKKGSLLSILDKTTTSMGSRRLKKWINQPLLQPEQINKRLAAVAELNSNFVRRNKIQEVLKDIYDLERLLSKISYQSINPRDMAALRNSLFLIPELKDRLKDFDSRYLADIHEDLDEMPELTAILSEALVEDPPHSSTEGGLIKEGFNQELDELRGECKAARDWIASLQASERKRTGISSLKVGFNKVFGYYIEVTKANLDKVPEDYERKQTLSNSERYIVPELKEKESIVLGAEEKINELEYDIFCSLREKCQDNISRIKQTAGSLADLDVLASLSQISLENDYCRPEIHSGDEISITAGRHPVVETMVDINFVPNHTRLDLSENRFLIITGPNMSGKSTYMRQVALITLMAQIGSFVPAASASIGLTDRIFTRVGASDDLSTGQSTFMVEMNEVSNIVHNATSRSLIILDEIGRGTSTYDGMSLAWAVSKYINNPKKIGARTLFATHYHEMTELANRIEGIKNLNVLVAEEDEEVRFLYQIEPGSARQSYGIEVGKLAGLPDEIIEEAGNILTRLESSNGNPAVRTKKFSKKLEQQNPDQLNFFSLTDKEKEVISELKELDLNNITPIKALETLYDFKQTLLGDE